MSAAFKFKKHRKDKEKEKEMKKVHSVMNIQQVTEIERLKQLGMALPLQFQAQWQNHCREIRSQHMEQINKISYSNCPYCAIRKLKSFWKLELQMNTDLHIKLHLFHKITFFDRVKRAFWHRYEKINFSVYSFINIFMGVQKLFNRS